ncbi:ArnT family glycosyltransferase [Candidatus Altiarchaeota archaeon]
MMAQNNNNPGFLQFCEKHPIHVVAAILLIAILFRAYDLAFFPLWDWDEGVNLDLTCNLLNGEARSFALNYSFMPHPPLYFLAGAAWLKISTLPCSIYALRLFSVFLSLISICLLYLVAKRIGGVFLGLSSSFLLAIYPTAIYFHHIAFANNLLSIFALFSIWAWLVFKDSKNKTWLWFACLSAGLAVIVEFTGAAFVLALLLLIWRFQRKLILPSAFLMALPPMIFAASVLHFLPQPFLSDLRYTLIRAHVTPEIIFFGLVALVIVYFAGPIFRPIKSLFIELAEDVRRDLPIYYAVATLAVFQRISVWNFLGWVDFYWLGVVGFFYITSKSNRSAVLHFFGSYFAVLILLNRMDHMMIPLYPLFSLGLAVFLPTIFSISMEYYQKLLRDFSRTDIRFFSLVMVVYPILILILLDVSIFLLERDIPREDYVADFELTNTLNRILEPDDVVITFSKLAPLTNARTATLVQSAAYSGRPFAYYRDDLPPQRFAYNISHKNARFMVLTPGILDWMNESEDTRWMFDEVKDWPRQNVSSFLVLENPGYL